MHAALVVVDMQEYFCRPDSALARWTRALGLTDTWYHDTVRGTVIPTIAALLDDLRAQGQTIVFTEFGSHAADGSDLPLWARRHNELAVQMIGKRCYPPLPDPSARVVHELAPGPGELVVPKITSGPLAGTDIARTLRDLGVERILVTGVATDVCVLGMARELADSDFDVVVVSDACATPSRESHEDALRIVQTFATVEAAGSLGMQRA